MLAGLVITLMTRMQHASESLGVQLVPAVLFGALLSAGQLFHCVLDSILMFAALISHAPFGYADWAVALGLVCAGQHRGGNRLRDGGPTAAGHRKCGRGTKCAGRCRIDAAGGIAK